VHFIVEFDYLNHSRIRFDYPIAGSTNVDDVATNLARLKEHVANVIRTAQYYAQLYQIGLRVYSVVDKTSDRHMQGALISTLQEFLIRPPNEGVRVVPSLEEMVQNFNRRLETNLPESNM
jgi:hypothetical protein